MYSSFIVGAFVLSYLQRLATAQLTGKISSIGAETDGVVTVWIANTGTANYSIEARNNLFDDANPYQPLVVKNLQGRPVTLVGTTAAYGPLNDYAFISMSPGTVWEKTLNMTEYIPPDPTVLKPYSECFSLFFPDGIFAVNTTNFQPNEDLATGFLGGDSTEIFVEATPVHINITVMAGKVLAAAAATATVGSQLPASLIPGTAVAGVGGAAPTAGSSIDDYIGAAGDTTSLFAKAHEQSH